MNCIDIGASTGGFTDCLLQMGAKSVYAVDSGQKQLDPSIEEDSRVVSIEKFNARFMEPSDFPHAFDIAVMDVSFISQTLIHPAIAKILMDDAYFITLIKPQFECGRNALNSHGIVKKSQYHTQAVQKVIDSALICGLSCIDLIKSPIEGGSGNIEFLALFQKSNSPSVKISENKIKTITQSK
jgi:23S rRNA (cytidine1920-2'-O)/16S rRNA (cytidine1409-2'-O)-methyltransferase